MKEHEEKIINEILKMIKDNIIIYYNEDKANFIQLREMCKNKNDKEIDQQKLVCLVQEVLYELMKCRYLYDFRSLE